jgi:pyruvyltransferase
VEVIGEDAVETPNLIAIGSILHWADRNSIVWGTGLIDDSVQLAVKPKSVLAVRGPLTWERLRQQGVRAPRIFGDPGVFLAQLYPKQPAKWALGIVPHYVDASEPFILQAAASGARIIDVSAPLEQYAAALSSCERVLSSSLHGLVFAHAYGIPAAWIRLSNRVLSDGFKFYDYYSSVGVSRSEVQLLTPDESLEALSQRCDLPVRQIDEGALRRALLDGLEAC